MLDLAITGGTCVLPTGSQPADIGVKDGRIVPGGRSWLAAGCGAHRVGPGSPGHPRRHRSAHPLLDAGACAGAARRADRSAVAGQQGRPAWRHDDPDRLRAMHPRAHHPGLDRADPGALEGQLLLRLRLPSHADGRGADAAFRPARRCDAGRPCQHQDLHHQHPAGQSRPHGAAWPHLGGAEGCRCSRWHRLHTRRGQRHRDVHVREADAREPRRLRAHGRGPQHAVGGAQLQPRDSLGRECRGRGALHGACLGGDRRGGAHRLARQGLPDVRRDPAPVPHVQRRGLQAAGRADVPYLPVAQVPRGPEAAVGGDQPRRHPGHRHRRAVLPAAHQAAGQPHRRHHRRQLRASSRAWG